MALFTGNLTIAQSVLAQFISVWLYCKLLQVSSALFVVGLLHYSKAQIPKNGTESTLLYSRKAANQDLNYSWLYCRRLYRIPLQHLGWIQPLSRETIALQTVAVVLLQMLNKIIVVFLQMLNKVTAVFSQTLNKISIFLVQPIRRLSRQLFGIDLIKIGIVYNVYASALRSVRSQIFRTELIKLHQLIVRIQIQMSTLETSPFQGRIVIYIHRQRNLEMYKDDIYISVGKLPSFAASFRLYVVVVVIVFLDLN